MKVSFFNKFVEKFLAKRENKKNHENLVCLFISIFN